MISYEVDALHPGHRVMRQASFMRGVGLIEGMFSGGDQRGKSRPPVLTVGHG